MSIVEAVEWREHAACLGKPTSWWFPEKGDYVTLVRAVRICMACPVQVECDKDAHRTRERYGIRAGRSRDVTSRGRAPKVAQIGTRSCYVKGCDHPECEAADRRYKRRRAG